MKRTRQVRVLIFRARAIIERGGDRTEAIRALDEAIALCRAMETDASRFRDLLSQPFYSRERS